MKKQQVKYRSAVCGIARDEDRYIAEWIAFHLAIGFDHIFIYDNLSVNPISSLLKQRILLNKVTVIRWPAIPNDNAQLSAYRHFLHTYQDWVEWAAVIDLDEFINLKQDRSILQFLNRFPSASAIEINWRIFGSSGEVSYQRRPMIERFKTASNIEFEPNILVKTIHRLSQTEMIYVHYGKYKNDAIVVSTDGTNIEASDRIKQAETNYAVAQINHYFVKSREEWEAKLRRGYADSTVRPPEMFDEYDRNEVEDASIMNRLPKLRRYIKNVRRFELMPSLKYKFAAAQRIIKFLG